MKNIETIAIDIDWTLIGSNGKISQNTKDLILKLQDRGINVILVSGRPTNSMIEIAKELKIDENYQVVLTGNGAKGYDVKNEKIVFDSPIEKSLAIKVFDYIENLPISPMLDDGKYLYVKDVFGGIITSLEGEKQNIIEYEARKSDFLLREVKSFQNDIEFNINNILCIVEPKNIENLIKDLKDKFGNDLYITQSAPFYIEFHKKGVNKAKGLKNLGINPETLIAFGDGINDIEMLKYSKYSVAMGNAVDELKEIADYITDTNDNEGVYKALCKFELNKLL